MLSGRAILGKTMRRVGAAVAVAALAAVVPAAVACGTESGRPLAAVVDAGQVGPSTTPADPAVTRELCAKAVKATAEGVRVFNTQIQLIEKAAADGDEEAIVTAAEVINQRITGMATTLRAYSRAPVSARVRVRLSQASATLRHLSSEEYDGTPADIRETLTDVRRELRAACR
jgi:hypothetical protein